MGDGESLGIDTDSKEWYPVKVLAKDGAYTDYSNVVARVHPSAALASSSSVGGISSVYVGFRISGKDVTRDDFSVVLPLQVDHELYSTLSIAPSSYVSTSATPSASSKVTASPKSTPPASPATKSPSFSFVGLVSQQPQSPITITSSQSIPPSPQSHFVISAFQSNGLDIVLVPNEVLMYIKRLMGSHTEARIEAKSIPRYLVPKWTKVILQPMLFYKESLIEDRTTVINSRVSPASTVLAQFPSSNIIRGAISGELVTPLTVIDDAGSIPLTGTAVIKRSGSIQLKLPKGVFEFSLRCLQNQINGINWGLLTTQTDLIVVPNSFHIANTFPNAIASIHHITQHDKQNFASWHQFHSIASKQICSSFILHGSSGCGKSYFSNLILSAVGYTCVNVWPGELTTLYPGSKSRGISYFFDLAKRVEPSALIFEEIESIFPPNSEDDETEGSAAIDTFLREIDNLTRNKARIIIVGLARVFSLVNVRVIKKVERSLLVDVTTPSERMRVINFFLDANNFLMNDLDSLQKLAFSNTHGYTTADLFALCKEAALNSKELPTITFKNIQDARVNIRPMVSNISVSVPNVKWSDVGGLEHVKQILKESVIWVYQQREHYLRMNIKPPKGVLLLGPPGTGKTLLAKAVANETNANFISVNISDVISAEIGESEKTIASIFSKAKLYHPTILFIDEIQAIFGSRSSGSFSSKIISQLLLEFDGIEEHDVIIIAATNCPEMIDESFFRPGRLDRLVHVPPPNQLEREDILNICCKDFVLSDDISFSEIASAIDRYTGADIRNLCRQVVFAALRRHKEKWMIEGDKEISITIDMSDFTDAIKKQSPSISVSSMNHYEQWMQSRRKRK